MLQIRDLLTFGSQFSYCVSARHWLPLPTSQCQILQPRKIESSRQRLSLFACTCHMKSMHMQTGKPDPTPEISPHFGACMDPPPQRTPGYLAEALRARRSDLRCSASNGEHVEGDEAVTKKKQRAGRFGASRARSVRRK